MKKMLKRVSGALLMLESSIILLSKEVFADIVGPNGQYIPSDDEPEIQTFFSSEITSLIVAAILIAVIIGVVFAVIVIVNKKSRNKKDNSQKTKSNDKVKHNG